MKVNVNFIVFQTEKMSRNIQNFFEKYEPPPPNEILYDRGIL